MLAKRARNLVPSATLGIDLKAKEMRAKGFDVISFGMGEPDFDTPEGIKEAAVSALRAGFTKYTPSGGIDELRDAIVAKLKRDNGLEYTRDEVAVSCGSKHTLASLAMVLFEKGDEVLIPAPYWVTYPEQIKLVDATPVIVPTSEATGFKILRDDLERVLTPRTKALILNTPSNPTGVVLDRNDLEAIATLAVERDLYIISDEAYENLTYDGARHISIASLGEAIRARTIVVNSVSKTYAMTGWRIGYAAGPKEVIQAVIDLQSQTANMTSFAQKGAVEALIGPQTPVVRMREEFARRRRYVLERLDKIPDVSYVRPFGAFFVFLNISAYFGRRFRDRIIQTSTDMAAYLLEEARVALVPGKDFGSDDHIRLSYTLSTDQLAKGLDRIEEALTKLRLGT